MQLVCLDAVDDGRGGRETRGGYLEGLKFRSGGLKNSNYFEWHPGGRRPGCGLWKPRNFLDFVQVVSCECLENPLILVSWAAEVIIFASIGAE